jgi:hypothetical protein
MAMRMRNPAHRERTVRVGWLVWAAVAATVLLLILRAEAAAQVSAYPRITGGEWARGPNLTDAQGRPQPRQEHAAVELNGFVYLIGGFVPMQPPPQPTAEEPEPFPFEGTGDVLAYTPVGHPAAPAAEQGKWLTLPGSSAFPRPHMHHLVAVNHRRQIWALGGHAGPFEPTALVFVFTPAGPGSPQGTWTPVRVSDGKPCGPGQRCLTLPSKRAAGAGVSIGSRIYLMGGVVPSPGSRDPVNESIRTTRSVVDRKSVV